MEEMPPRLFRVPKKMWNEWTMNLRDGQSQQVFISTTKIYPLVCCYTFLINIKCCYGNMNKQTCIHKHVLL